MRIGPAFLQTFATQIIQSVASFTAAALIARGLGPAGQGQYALAVAAVGLVATVGAGGQYEWHVLVSAGESSRGRALVVRSVVQSLAVGVALALSQSLWRPALGPLGREVAPILLVLILSLEILALLLRGINLGQHHILAFNLATLLQRGVLLAGVGALTMAGSVRVETVLTAWLCAVAFNISLSTTWIWRRSGTAAIHWDRVTDGWGHSLQTGLRALLTVALGLVLIRTDVYMLGPLLGVPAVGQISIASTFAEYLWYVPTILASVLFAAVAADRGSESVLRIARATRAAVVLLVPVVAVLAVAGGWLVPFIYGQAYKTAGMVFVLLLPGMFSISLHLIVDAYFAGAGFPPISYIGAAAALLLKVILNLLLVPKLGLAGAALATSSAFSALLVIKIVALHRATGVGMRTMFLPTSDDLRQCVAVGREWVARVKRSRPKQVS